MTRFRAFLHALRLSKTKKAKQNISRSRPLGAPQREFAPAPSAHAAARRIKEGSNVEISRWTRALLKTESRCEHQEGRLTNLRLAYLLRHRIVIGRLRIGAQDDEEHILPRRSMHEQWKPAPSGDEVLFGAPRWRQKDERRISSASSELFPSGSPAHQASLRPSR